MTFSALRRELISVFNSEAACVPEERDAKHYADAVICSRFGIDFSQLIMKADDIVPDKEINECVSMIRRVSAGEPVQYVCGEAPFYGKMFFVDRSVLIPRHDTEVLLKEVLDRASQICGNDNAAGNAKRLSILDLCTGSGILAVCIKSDLPGAKVYASDISEKALSVASKNALRHEADVSFILSDLFESFPQDDRFDIIVSNPPYVSNAEYDVLDSSVRCFEPSLALIGGEDGLDFYRSIVSNAPRYIKRGGWLCLEIGDTQAASVSGMLIRRGFKEVTVTRDIAGRDRVVCGKL
ncbi:MAG: peptide chain release factor N(5)-glutamine methyltransferase [Clostridia bacterium]|nr:peptide chain release factor N(5)-glutamine methyltransferase [Clostridia bacterium]